MLSFAHWHAPIYHALRFFFPPLLRQQFRFSSCVLCCYDSLFPCLMPSMWLRLQRCCFTISHHIFSVGSVQQANGTKHNTLDAWNVVSRCITHPGILWHCVYKSIMWLFSSLYEHSPHVSVENITSMILWEGLNSTQIAQQYFERIPYFPMVSILFYPFFFLHPFHACGVVCVDYG